MFLKSLRNAGRGEKHLNKDFLLQNSHLLSSALCMTNNSTESMQSPKSIINNKPTLRMEKLQQSKTKKNTLFVPGNVTLQILGSGSNGSPASVYLFTDHSRYLFNCGEGTQRLAHEHKTKLARLDQIFVTRNTWPTIGGFPGLALTVQDAGVKELSLHGPPYLENILFSMKRFVVLKNLKLKTVDCTKIHDFEDAVMSVKCLPMYRITDDTAIQNCITNGSTEEQIAITYICKLKPRPGPLNLEKCVAHGVPPGPLLGLLKSGIDVTLDNGTIVKSKEVSEPDEDPSSFMFLDIPSLDFLRNLEKYKDLVINSKMNPDNTPEMLLVVHFSPCEVIKSNVYQTFLEKFPSKTQHIYLNCKQNTFSGYIAAHRIQYQLNLVNPKVFPLLAETNLNNKQKIIKLDKEFINGNEDKVTSKSADNHLKDIGVMTYYHFRPKKGLDRTFEAKLTPLDYIQETQTLKDFPDLVQKLKKDLSFKENVLVSNTQYPVITFLGTGSCIPNKTRNVSSILIQSRKDSFVLLDCGEGTLGQIQRFFGCKQAEVVIKNLKCIYVSHLHADHHIGLIGLLAERLKLLGIKEDIEKVVLLAPKQIEPWLSFYHERICNIKNSYELIGNAEIMNEPLNLYTLNAAYGIESIQTCLVKHCAHSFGVRINVLDQEEENKTIKITYSGDTMPCQDLIKLGVNSDILIHEATMEDDLIEEAKYKTHSTISQAIQQGQLMNARHTILTHFSQRYAKLPRLNSTFCSSKSLENNCKLIENVSIAFDNMKVSLKDLEHFHIMYPAMRSLFAEHADELEQKALKREMKLERKRRLLSS